MISVHFILKYYDKTNIYTCVSSASAVTNVCPLRFDSNLRALMLIVKMNLI